MNMQNSKQTNKKYIAAAVIEQDGKVLIAQRADDVFRGKWEFPGGKVEGNETLEECLKRELFEELSIQAEIGEYFCTSTFYYKDTFYDMCVFKVSAFKGEIMLNEHSTIAWVEPNELNQYTFPDPDLPIVELLQRVTNKQ